MWSLGPCTQGILKYGHGCISVRFFAASSRSKYVSPRRPNVQSRSYCPPVWPLIESAHTSIIPALTTTNKTMAHTSGPLKEGKDSYQAPSKGSRWTIQRQFPALAEPSTTRSSPAMLAHARDSSLFGFRVSRLEHQKFEELYFTVLCVNEWRGLCGCSISATFLAHNSVAAAYVRVGLQTRIIACLWPVGNTCCLFRLCLRYSVDVCEAHVLKNLSYMP